MKTNEIYVSNNGYGWEEALTETEKYADYRQLIGKEKIHLRLIAEEMLGMVETIAGDFEANFWIDDDDKAYYAHLNAAVLMDSKIRSTLIETSTSGKNAAAKGIMGKIRDVFQAFMAGRNDTVTVLSEYYGGFSGYELSGMGAFSSTNIWSLSCYKETVQGRKNDDKIEKWDELEKSIIANIADDVTVGIKGNNVEMVITKKWKTGKE